MGDESRWRRYVRVWRADPRADVADELSFHIEERTRLNIERGLDPAMARAEAERMFGDVARIQRELVAEGEPVARRARIGDVLGDIARDVRIACRSLLRAPVFTVTAGLALALGIGASTAVFTALTAVLLQPLPYADADRVVALYNRWEGDERANLSPAEYIDYAERTRAFSALGVYARTNANVVEGDAAERVRAVNLTPSTFAALGVTPAMGRVFVEGDDTADGGAVVVLAHEYWQSRLGGAADVIGRSMNINGEALTVVGVLPAGVRLPATYADVDPPALFMALHIDPANVPPRGSHYLTSVARLEPGWTLAAADAEVKRVARDMASAYIDDYPADMRFSAFVRPIHQDVVGGTRRLLLVLGVAVGLVMLIACANVSSLVLTRTEDRRREFAVRSAIGGGRWRIARQLLLEHLVLAGVAGGAGIVLALAGTQALALLQPGNVPRLADAQVDSSALLFTVVLSLVATLLVALAPLRFGFSGYDALREAGARTTGSRATQRVRRTLIAAEVALSIILLAGAGLLLRSFANMIGLDPGFRTERLLTVTVLAPPSKYEDDASRRTFFARLVNDASAIPGVEAAGAVVNLPLVAGVFDLDIELPGRPLAEGDVSPQLDWQVVTPGYFDAMGIEIVRGRAISNIDDARAPGAVVLSESAARKYWGDTDPIGQRFKLGAGAGPGWVTVVGVARDVRQNALTLEPPAMMYLPHGQFTFWHGGNAPATMALVLHAASEPMALLSPLREVMRRIDPYVPLSNVRTMEQVVSTAVAQPRFATSVVGGFALLALVLAVIGVYGLVAYSVARRTREIAVRMALGAAARNVVRQIVIQGMIPVMIGAMLGVAGAFMLTRVLDTMLFGVAPRDPVTLAGTVLVLGLTAVVAAVLPARRAARVTPMGALREE